MLGQNGYVNGTMTKDETIKVQAKYHWIKWLWFYFMFATLGLVALACISLAFTFYLNKDIEAAAGLAVLGRSFRCLSFCFVFVPASDRNGLHQSPGGV